MAATLARIWRHPVKSLGAEALEGVTLEAGRAMPHDRRWAVAHASGRWDPEHPVWMECGNFLRVARVPALAQVAARLDADTGTLTLSHPDAPELVARPDAPEGAAAVCQWAEALAGDQRPGPYRLAQVPGTALGDTDDPAVSIASLSSLRALGERLGQRLDPRRFRANLWIDGLVPWEEEDWPGRVVSIGAVRVRVIEQIERCRATEASPQSGRRDLATLSTLDEARGARTFGVYAEVLNDGRLGVGDAVEVVS